MVKDQGDWGTEMVGEGRILRQLLEPHLLVLLGKGKS